MSKKIPYSNIHISIYEKNFGPRPIDSHGRKYHIHHIDGNHNNNDILNLKAVSAEEHFKIHLDQNDLTAALYLSQFLDLSGKEISELAKKAAKRRVEDGTHNFLGNKNPARIKSRLGKHHWQGPASNQQRIDDGTHNFLGDRNPNKKRIAEGTHNLIGDKNPNHKRLANGTHNFLGPETNRKRIEDGTHNFLGDKHPNHRRIKNGTHHFGKEFTKKLLETGKHVNTKIFQCPYCQKIGKGPVMKRHHFEKCKVKKS
jgi:hypothetical protein